MARAQRRNSRSISSWRPISWVSDALDLNGAEIAVLEEIADQTARAPGDHDSIRLGQSLQSGGEVGRFTDDRLFLRGSFANQIADDHQPRGDPDARLQLDRFDIEATDNVDGAEPRPHRPLGVVLMRLRVAEIDQYAVAHVPGDEAIKPGDDLGDGAVVCADDFVQILGIEAGGKFGRADQIGEQYGQLPAFGSAWLGAGFLS